jgi:hypothetical protein
VFVGGPVGMVGAVSRTLEDRLAAHNGKRARSANAHSFGDRLRRSHNGADPIDRLLAAAGGDVLRIPHYGEEGYDAWQRDISVRDRKRLVAAGAVTRQGGAPCDVLLQACAAGRVVLAGVENMGADEFLTYWCRECLRGLDIRAELRAGGGVDEDPRTELEYLADVWSSVVLVDESGELLESHTVPVPGDFVPDDDRVPIDPVTGEPMVLAPVGTVAPAPAVVASAPQDAPAWFTEWRARLVYAPKRDLLDRLAGWAWQGGPVPTIPADGWATDVVDKFTRRARVVVPR